MCSPRLFAAPRRFAGQDWTGGGSAARPLLALRAARQSCDLGPARLGKEGGCSTSLAVAAGRAWGGGFGVRTVGGPCI